MTWAIFNVKHPSYQEERAIKCWTRVFFFFFEHLVNHLFCFFRFFHFFGVPVASLLCVCVWEEQSSRNNVTPTEGNRKTSHWESSVWEAVTVNTWKQRGWSLWKIREANTETELLSNFNIYIYICLNVISDKRIGNKCQSMFENA